MMRRPSFMLVLVWPGAWLVGCNDGAKENRSHVSALSTTSLTQPPTAKPTSSTPVSPGKTGGAEVTIYVKDMKNRLNLT
jgi:hypothetical protein